METKKCTKCLEEKELTEFHKRKYSSTGINPQCKKCIYLYKNSPSVKSKSKKYYLKIKKRKSLLNKLDYIKNKNKRLERQKNNRESIRKWELEYRRNYRLKNKEKLNKRIREQKTKRRKIDPLFKLKERLRGRIRSYISDSGYIKTSKTEEILGCNFETVKKHIERQFKKGMTWQNHGHLGEVWHIDHKIPLASAKTEEELIKLCHYTNLQPLWERDNRYKGAKILPVQTVLTI